MKINVLTAPDVEWIRAYPVRRGMFNEMARRLQIDKSTVKRAYAGDTWAHVPFPSNS